MTTLAAEKKNAYVVLATVNVNFPLYHLLRALSGNACERLSSLPVMHKAPGRTLYCLLFSQNCEALFFLSTSK